MSRISLVAQMAKKSACNAGDQSLIPGPGSSPGERNCYLLQDSCLENFMDKGAWQAMVHGVAESQTRLSKFHSLILTECVKDKEVAS